MEASLGERVKESGSLDLLLCWEAGPWDVLSRTEAEMLCPDRDTTASRTISWPCLCKVAWLPELGRWPAVACPASSCPQSTCTWPRADSFPSALSKSEDWPVWGAKE